MRFDYQVDVAPVTRKLFPGDLKTKIIIQLSGIDQWRRAGLPFQEIPPLTSFGRDDKTPHPPFEHLPLRGKAFVNECERCVNKGLFCCRLFLSVRIYGCKTQYSECKQERKQARREKRKKRRI